MPPQVPSEESEVSDNETLEKTATKSAADEDEDEDMENGDKDDDEEGGDGAEEEYVVDSIEGHDWDAVDGCWKYKTKWVGWELATDRTWEPKENLEGANESLEEYWESIGGEPDPKGPPLKGTKKRARQSGVDSDTKKARISPQPPKSARSRKSELVDDPENWGPGDDKDWEPPKATKDAWEDSLIAVETIEPDEDGNHWAYLRWSILDKHGKHRHTKHPLAAVYKAAPQVMLKFYEKHLVFSGKPK